MPVSTTWDWIVQVNPAASAARNPRAVAGLLPPGGDNFKSSTVWARWARCSSARSGETAAQAGAGASGRRRHPVVRARFAEADRSLSLPMIRNIADQWAAADINLPAAWNISTGSHNVVVAVIDSGVDYTDPDLAANIWTNPNAGQRRLRRRRTRLQLRQRHRQPNGRQRPRHSRGRHHRGGRRQRHGVAGVNWNVTIMPLKFLDANGDGYTSDAIRAINYAIMERTEYGVNVRVINASWSSGVNDPGLTAAIQAAGNAGILFVAAAGNSGTNNDVTPQYPANAGLANVISVAASNSSNQLASFSDYGANTVNIAAPGVDIYSTLPGGKYGYLSGTSMATPEVAGVAALAWAVDPSATVAQVRNALLQGVDKVPSLAGKVSSGGRLDAYNTLKLLASRRPTPLTNSYAPPTPTNSAPSPTPTPTRRASVHLSLITGSTSVQSGDTVSLVAQGVTATGSSPVSTSISIATAAANGTRPTPT